MNDFGFAGEPVTLEVMPQDYQDRLDDDVTIRFYASVYVKETNQFWAGDEDITLNRPKINVQVYTFYSTCYLIVFIP